MGARGALVLAAEDPESVHAARGERVLAAATPPDDVSSGNVIGGGLRLKTRSAPCSIALPERCSSR
jgi:hypothetical protein